MTPKSICTINKQDLISLLPLLQAGYPIQQGLQILGGYEPVLVELEKGKKFEEFIHYDSSYFFQSFQFFLSVSSIDQAIQEAYEYEQMKKSLQSLWIKETSYPLVVLLFSLVVFIFFDLLIYPQLFNMISFHSSFEFHRILSLILKLLLLLFLIICLSLICLYIYSKRNEEVKKKVFLFLIQFSIIKKMISYDYALHTLVLSKRGFSTRNIFESLKQLRTSYFLQVLIKQMADDLEHGKEMIDVVDHCMYLDDRFKQFYKMGSYTQNFDESMEHYCEFQKEELKKMIQKSAKVVSLMAYMLIAFLVVSIYQMLLTPLEQLNQL